MKASVACVVATCVALAAAGQNLASKSYVRISSAVVEEVATIGRAEVFVEVDTPFVPEGHLDGPRVLAGQRATIRRALDEVAQRAGAAGILVRQRFASIPFFTASVDDEQLAALAAMPGVVSVTPATSGGVASSGGALIAGERHTTETPQLAQTAPFIDAPAAWAAGATGAGWTVAVAGTGVDRFHPFLDGKVISEACFSGAGGAANPGQHQSLCPGGALASTAAGSAAPCTPIDECWSGTHYAGVAAGAHGPSQYPSGVAPGASLIAVQMFTRATSPTICGIFGAPTPCLVWYTVDVVAALEHILTLAGPNNANRVAAAFVDANSGGYATQRACDADFPSIKAAIDNLRSLGIATTPGAGSWGYTNAVSAPGCISSAVGVGASTSTDTIASFSDRAPFLPLMAPGYPLIYSAYPGNGTAMAYGTGPASLHALGTWAVLRQAVPDASVGQIVAALRETGAPVVDTAVTPNVTHRRLRVNAARLALLGGPTTGPPGPPGTPAVSGNGNALTFAWSAPLTGGAPVTYTVVARQASGGPVIATLPVGSELGTSVVAPNGRYFVTVAATNASGVSLESDGVAFSVPIVPPPPGAPEQLQVVVTGTSATFSWQPPATGGPVSNYVLRASASPGGAPIASLTATAAPTFSVGGIPPGTYYVRVAAQNLSGIGSPSNEVTVTVEPPSLPGAAVISPAVVSGTTVTLSWTPGPGGIADSWIVAAALVPGGPPVATLPSATTSLSVNAPPGTYFVSVRGVNVAGTGLVSNEVEVAIP